MCRLLAGCPRGSPAPLRAVTLAASWSPRGDTGEGTLKWLPYGELRDQRSSPPPPDQALARPAETLSSLGGGPSRAPACLVAAGEAARKAANVPAFRLMQDCWEFSPPLGLLGARRKGGRAGGARDPWAAHAAAAGGSRLGLQPRPPRVASPWASSLVRNDQTGLESDPSHPRKLIS